MSAEFFSSPYVAHEVIKLMLKRGIQVVDAEILMLCITFKENCPDVRNTKVVDIIKALTEYNTRLTIYDPWANPVEVKHEYGVYTVSELPSKKFDAIILAVAHNEFITLDINSLKNANAIVFDVKGILNDADGRL